MVSVTYPDAPIYTVPGAVRITTAHELPSAAFRMPEPQLLDDTFVEARQRFPNLTVNAIHLSEASIDRQLRADFGFAYRALAYIGRTEKVDLDRHAADWGSVLVSVMAEHGFTMPLVWGVAVVLAAYAWRDIPIEMGEGVTTTRLGLMRRGGRMPVWPGRG